MGKILTTEAASRQSAGNAQVSLSGPDASSDYSDRLAAGFIVNP
jgi:hypothetical protein